MDQSVAGSDDWGFQPAKGGMAIEAKLGMFIIMILLGAFGFLVYRKVDQHQQMASTTETKTESTKEESLGVLDTDGGLIAQSSDSDAESAVSFDPLPTRDISNDPESESINFLEEDSQETPVVTFDPGSDPGSDPRDGHDDEFTVSIPEVDSTKAASDSDPFAPQEVATTEDPVALGEDIAALQFDETDDIDLTPDTNIAGRVMSDADDFTEPNSTGQGSFVFDESPAAPPIDDFGQVAETDSTQTTDVATLDPQEPNDGWSNAGNDDSTDLVFDPEEAPADATLAFDDEPIGDTFDDTPVIDDRLVAEQKPFDAIDLAESEPELELMDEPGFQTPDEDIVIADDATFDALDNEAEQPEPGFAFADEPADAPDTNFGDFDEEPQELLVLGEPNVAEPPTPAEDLELNFSEAPTVALQDAGNDAAAQLRPVVPARGEQPILARKDGDFSVPGFAYENRVVTASAEEEPYDVTEVQPGDNYWKISRRAYGTSRYFSALALYNHRRIADPKKLRPGMKVLIPDAEVLEQKYPQLFRDSAPRKQQPTGYFVQPDGTAAYRIGERDTLSQIAQKHLGRSSRWIQIYRLNQNVLSNPNRLKPGTVIILPDSATNVHMVP